ncbi:VOC family protein [Mycobacterium tuberculosis]|uniref:VOC family protein n=1 Tax=Mycobacterium tuberculosis TaxID=1773 RepID=UPI00272D042B|nr:VOC family protein [Mycobacterium tuberculosis]
MLGIQQIAIGGPDKTRLQKLWVEMLGLQLTGTFRSERENVDEDICAMGRRAHLHAPAVSRGRPDPNRPPAKAGHKG